eukprot:2592192-Rhodomonas_salina.1
MSDSPVDPQGEDGHKEDSMKTISESEGELSDVNVEMQEMSPEGSNFLCTRLAMSSYDLTRCAVRWG